MKTLFEIGIVIGLTISVIALLFGLIASVSEFIGLIKPKKKTKYYITNSTGNVFREYPTKSQRDKALEEYNKYHWKFKAEDVVY